MNEGTQPGDTIEPAPDPTETTTGTGASTPDADVSGPATADVTVAVPGWYRVVAIVALLWNLMGCAAFAMEIFAPEMVLKTMTAEQQEWARSIPGWIYVVYGVAVFTGVAGSLGLIIRKGWSVPLFAVCLAAVLVQMGYSFIIAGGIEVLGTVDLIMPAVVIVLAGILLWFSWSARDKGWLVS